MKNINKTIIALMIAGIFSIILLFIIGNRFIFESRKGLYEEKLNYLEEISKKSADNVSQQVQGNISAVDAIATFIGGKDESTIESFMPLLKKEAEKNSFKRMGIIFPDGSTITTDGLTFNSGDRKYFHQAMNGENAVSDELIDKTDGEKINVFSVPIYKSGEIVGVVFATNSQERFSKTLDITSFNGRGYSYIIKSDGSPVIKNKHPDSIGDFENFFNELIDRGVAQNNIAKFKADVLKCQNGSFEYVRDNIPRQLCYSKIGINDWYIVSSVEASAISQKSDLLIRNLIIIVIIVILVIIFSSLIVILLLKTNNKRLKKIAYTDGVTGFSNWAEFSIVAKGILEKNPQCGYALVIMDVNKFKIINDVFGHEKGNAVLRHIAKTLNETVCEGETFSRTSSDNFSVLLKYESDEKIIKRLQGIFEKVKKYIEGYKIELSAGIYHIADNSLDINVLSERANISKAIAKSKNDTTCCFFKEENRIGILREKEIENVMESALINGEFELYLQPKVSLLTDRIMGAEALVRWNKAGKELIFPDGFIPLFEKNGFIRKLDLYMFEEATKLIAKWIKEKPNKAIPISVNISRTHLTNQNLPQKMAEISKKYSVNPKMMEIELTESAEHFDIQNMIDMMQKIKEEGFLLSIDDFGTGYSSFSSIKDFPADFIKIDKTFLDGIATNKKDENIVFGIITMTQGIGMMVVAEGVETAEQVEILKEMGCDIAQGYYYSKPIPVLDFEKLI